MAMSVYEVLALKFGSKEVDKSSKYYRFDTFDEPDTTATLNFYFWLLRNEKHTVLVDCGYDVDRAAARGYRQDHAPLDLLAELDVSADDVDHIVITHLHFDHVGNLDLFPNATVTLSRAEFDYWTGPFNDREFLCFAGDRYDVEQIERLHREGRLNLVDGETEIFPGIRLTPVRGHTPGQLLTQVSSRTGEIVLASDAIHWYEEMNKDRPYWVFHDLEGMFRGYQMLRELDARPNYTVIAGHDPSDMDFFVRLSDTCIDLTQRAPAYAQRRTH